MKNKPIEKPVLYGCATCGTVPKTVLSKDKGWFGGDMHIVTITIDDFTYEVTEEDDYFTVEEIEKRFGDKLKKCTTAEIFNMTPLHDETYEYNTDDGNWYLVKQGEGFA